MAAENPLLITDTNVSGALKRVYQAYRANVFPVATPLLAQIEKGKSGGPKNMRFGGEGVFWDVVLSRPVGMTASDAGYFPNTANAVEKQATLGIKRTYVSRQIDRLAARGTQSKEAAFVSFVRKILKEALDAARLGQQEILHGDGSGTKAEVTVVNSTTSIDVSKPYGVTGAGQGGLLLDVGMHIAVLDASASFAVLGRATISAITNSGDTAVVTLDTAVVGMAAGDILVACTTSDTSRNAVPNGLINSLNRGGSYASLCGLSSATYARWDSTRMTAGTDTPDAAQPGEMDVFDLILRIKGRSGEDASMKPGEFLFLTTPGVGKKIAETFLGQRQWTMGEKVLKGGYKALEICGIPLITDSWCPAGTVYLIHLPSMTWIDLEDWKPVSFEDAPEWRPISGRDAFEYNLASFWNFGPLVRNAHGQISGYTDTARYSHVM